MRHPPPHFKGAASAGRPNPLVNANNPLWQEARNLRLKKRFSQNFLIRESVLERIAECLSVQPDETVLEIGAGAGFLTQQLLKYPARLTAVEVDPRMCRYLQEKFAAFSPEKFQLVAQDILRFDFTALPTERFKVVGNLPYQITSPILFLLAGELNDLNYSLRRRIDQITVMVQKEVGERICAAPGQRCYNALSIALQFWFEPRYEFTVPAQDFYPVPKVDSAVISLTPRQAPLVQVADQALFARLVRAAFSQKRKTVRNALINNGFASAELLDKIFSATGVNPTLRAEAIPIVAFGELANVFSSNSG